MGRGAWLATVHGVERVRHIWATNIFLWVTWCANHFTLLGFSFFQFLSCKLQDISYWIFNFILPSCIILWFLILWKLLWLSTGIFVLIQLSVYSANTTEHLWCTRAALDSRKWLWKRNMLPTHQFSSVTQSCLTLCDPMNCSMPGLPVHHQLLVSTQTYVHWVGDAI